MARARSTSDRDRPRQLELLCRQHGLALTVQRRAVLEAIQGRTDHPTADDVYETVKERVPGISRTTVYRVLDTLAAIGAITKACSPGATVRYDPKTHRHHHLACMGCDTLLDLEDERLSRRIKLADVPAGTFEIHDFSIQFRGLCVACKRTQSAKQPRPTTRAARDSDKHRVDSRRGSPAAKRRTKR